MIRSIFTAALAATFGALAIGPVHERVLDQLWQPAEAFSIGLVAVAAGLIAAVVLPWRKPAQIADRLSDLKIQRERVKLALDEAALARAEGKIGPITISTPAVTVTTSAAHERVGGFDAKGVWR